MTTPAFTPTHVSTRHDGWTAERQREFLQALADSGCVDQAAQHVGMNRSSVYRLRRHPDCKAFDEACWHAQQYNAAQLCDSLLSQCIHGIVQPRYYRGEIVGERRTYIPGTALALLKRLEDKCEAYQQMRRATGFGTHEDELARCATELENVAVDDNFITNNPHWAL